jgi:hypothetical protein
VEKQGGSSDSVAHLSSLEKEVRAISAALNEVKERNKEFMEFLDCRKKLCTSTMLGSIMFSKVPAYQEDIEGGHQRICCVTKDYVRLPPIASCCAT